MKNWIKLGFIAFVVVLQSCGSSKNIQEEKLAKVDDKELIAALDSISKSLPNFISTRIDTKYSDNKQNQSFKTSLKIDKGTAIHALITYAGLPIITAYVTPDSVKISNKKNKCYITENLHFFKQQFGIDFSFNNLEELLLGRPLNYNSSRKYHRINDPYNYVIATQKKIENEGELVFIYHLSTDLKHLKRVEIISYADEANIVINYPEYYVDTQFSAPKLVDVAIKTKKNNINIVLSYDRMEINVPKEMIIVIPESYANCN